tara:strand:+ start:833 stop:2101 length:1269 start_codon:yes stop_codon:yes gene_type:complete
MSRFKKFLLITLALFCLAIIIGLGEQARKTSNKIEATNSLTQERKYQEAITQLESIRNEWFNKTFKTKRQDIQDKIEFNQKLMEDEKEYSDGLSQIEQNNLQAAKDLFSKISDDSPYKEDALTKISELDQKILTQLAQGLNGTSNQEDSEREKKDQGQIVDESAQKRITELEKKIQELQQSNQINPDTSYIDANAQTFLSATAQIVCYLYPEYNEVSLTASGTIWYNDGLYWVLTNDHVLYEPYYYNDACAVVIIKDLHKAVEDFGNAVATNDILLYEIDFENYFYSNIPGDDLATALIRQTEHSPQPLSLLEGVALKPETENCNKYYELNTPVKIIGYPATGSVIPTITEGIISSFEKEGDVYYYLTSAKIEQGNSGGIAVTEDFSCTVGIPTFVEIGEIESMGRILMLSEVEISDFLYAP